MPVVYTYIGGPGSIQYASGVYYPPSAVNAVEWALTVPTYWPVDQVGDPGDYTPRSWRRIGYIVPIESQRGASLEPMWLHELAGVHVDLSGITWSVIYWVIGPGCSIYLNTYAAALPEPSQTARIHRSTGLVVTNNTDTVIPFDSTVYADGGMVDLATYPNRITIAESGRYNVAVGYSWEANLSGDRTISIYQNASTLVAMQQVPANNYADGTVGVASTPGPVELAAGDYLRAFARQRSGGSLTLQTTAGLTTDMSVWRVK